MESMEENLPPGFRFHPTDEELITFYLSNKVSDFSFTSKAIVDVDLNKCEPWDLPEKASMGEKEWYFFSLRDRKYPTGLRTNRATEAGYWKTTGKDKEIFRSGNLLIGMKKTLVFYRGRAPKGHKTNWVMHEYRLHNNLLSYKPAKEEWVVCRIFQKSVTIKKAQPTSPSLDSPDDTNINTNEFGDIMCLPNMMNTISTSTNPNSLQTYSDLNNIEGNTNLNLNWASLPSLTSLLTPNLNTTVNSLLFRALQLRNAYQQQPTSNIDYSSFLGQGLPFGVDSSSNHDPSLSCNIIKPSLDINTSTQQSSHEEELPFNMDSIW